VYAPARKPGFAWPETGGAGRVSVSGIETGCKKGSIAPMRALENALGVTCDDLAEQRFALIAQG